MKPWTPDDQLKLNQIRGSEPWHTAYKVVDMTTPMHPEDGQLLCLVRHPGEKTEYAYWATHDQIARWESIAPKIQNPNAVHEMLLREPNLTVEELLTRLSPR